MAISTINSSGLNQAGNTVFCTTSGNVGIGTSSPAHKLHVAGNAFVPLTNSYYCYTADYGMGTPDSAGLQVFTGSNDSIRFGVRSSGTFTERARIDSSGNLLVGTTSAAADAVGARLLASNQIQASKSSDWSFRMGRTTSSGIIAEIYYNTSRVGDIATNGSNTTYNSASDYRLKENIVPMTGALEKILTLNPVTYNWKVDGSNGQGFIAHELQEVVPDAVRGVKDEIDENGNPVYQGIDTSFLVATLTAAIQELKAIVDAQGAEIAALKGTA